MTFAFSHPIRLGRILQRRKRFFADVILDDGEMITAYLPNTGSMESCWLPEDPALLTYAPSPTRKMPYTLEAICRNNDWIGVNTHRANDLFAQGLIRQSWRDLKHLEIVQREIKIHDSRLDFLLQDKQTKELTYAEVKSVTLSLAPQLAAFPDTKTLRGQKHLQELIRLKQQGINVLIIYFIQRQHITFFRAASERDATFADLVDKAKEAQIPMHLLHCYPTPKGFVLGEAIQWQITKS